MADEFDAQAIINKALSVGSAEESKSEDQALQNSKTPEPTEPRNDVVAEDEFDAQKIIAKAMGEEPTGSKDASKKAPARKTDYLIPAFSKKEEDLDEFDRFQLESVEDPEMLKEFPPSVRLTDKQKRALWEHERAQKFLTWENAKAAGTGFWEFAKSIGRAGLTVIDAIPMTTEIPDPEEAKEKSDKLTKVISDVLAPVAGLPLSIAELAIERENGSRFNDWFYEKFGSQTPEQSFQNWSRRRDTEQAFASYKQKYPSTFHRLLNTYEFPREAAAVIGAAFDNRQDIDWNTKKQQAREIVDNYVRDAKFGPENPDVYALGTLVAPEGSGMGTFGATMMAGRALREGVPALASGIGSVARGSAASAAIKTAEAAAALNRAEAMTVAATDAGVDFTPDVIAQINKQSTQGGLSGWTPVGRPAAEVEAVSRVGTFGRSANEVNAINEAKAAVARDKFAAEVNQRFTKPGLAERAATEVDAKLMAASEKVKGIAEKVPETLKFLAPYAAGGTVAGVVSEGDPAQTLLGTVGLRFAGKLAANAPAATAAILKARRLSTGGRIGTFEMLGRTIDEASPKTKAIFKESGPIIDKTLNNLADISLEGANAGLIAIASGVLDSSTPEEIAELVGQGFLFAAKGKVLSKAKSIFFQNPAMAQREVRQARIDAAKQFNSLSPASKEGLIGVADWNLEIARNQAILERKIAERDAATGEERSKLDVEVAAREKAIDQLKRADSATRDFFTRDIVRQVGELSGFVNGMTRAGQNDLRIEILEPADMAQLVLKGRNASELKPDEAELLSAILSKQGFYAEPGEGGIDPMRPTIAVSAPRIRSRMLSRGQTVSDALAHEVGHHLHNVPEFNERMATAYKLLFGIRREDAAGNVYEEKPGMYSDSDLLERFDQYAQRAKGESDAQFKARRDQLARDAGLFDEKSGTLNEAAVIDYMKKELIADLAGRGLTSGILTKDSKMRRAMDLALVEAKMGVLDSIRAKIGSVLFDNAKYADDPNQFEGFTGVKFTPEVEAAVRNALREMREMDGLVARMEEEGEGPKISRVELMKSKALRDRYGKDSGLFKVVFEAQAYDAAGNPVGKPVEVSGTDVMEGIWKNSSGVTMPMEKSNQTEGFGALPGALRAAPVPAGGTVKIRSRIATEADGVTPILLTPKETKQVLRSRKEAINAALDTPDQGTPGRFEPVREGSETYRGTFTPLQIQAIKNIPESILPRSMKARMLEINDLVAKADGTRLFIDYAAMMNDNGKYQAFSPRLYDVIPIGMHMSKAGNFLVTTISYGRLLSKLNLWSERMPNRLSLWNGNKEVFMDEFINKYLMNWQYREQDATGRELYPRGRPGEFGLDSNPDVALQKKDIFNDFLNQTTSETPETAPRTRIPRRRGDPRGKDLDRTIMSVRIDHVTDMAVNESGQKVPINYGNAVRSFAPEQAAEAQQERQEAIDRGLRVLGIRRPGTMRFAPEDKPETGFFYSKLDNLVYEKMPRIATKEQVMALIDPKRGSGIKPDEIKWRGVEQAIEGIASENNGKVPKDALDRYLRLESSLDFRRSEYKGKQLFQLENLETGDVEIYDTREQALAAVNNAALSIAEDRYRIEKEENGTWYRVEDSEGADSESFSSLEKAEQQRKILVREFVREFSDNYEINESFESGTHYSDLVSPGNSSNYKEVIITSPASRYTSHHPGFDETPNYVSHYRSTDRVDSNGINGFFIEEIQSDLHQSAKKKGYSSLNNEQLEELNNEAEAIQNKANESEQLAIDYIGKLRLLEGMLVEQVIFKTLEVAEKEGILNIDARESYVKRFLAELYFSVRPEYRQKWLEDAYQSMELKYYKSEVSSQRENAKELMEKIGNNIADSDSVAKIYKGMIKWNELYQEETKESKRLEEEALKKRQEFNYENRKISDAPFRGDWPLQTFKRALADAVSDGKKWIGWTDGKTQADRYSLERAISSIRIDKQDSQFSQFNKGERSLTIELETGRDIKYVYFPDGSIAGIEVGKKLSDVIGDELASKGLSANEGDIISGEDLKVGGEGMRGFYDKILPNEIGKYVKQWGAKVEKSTITTNGKQKANIWRVDISPEMADSIKRVGQPRFAPEDADLSAQKASVRFVPEEMDTRAKFRFLMRNKEKKPVPTQEQLDERKARLPEYTTQIDTEKVGDNTWYRIFVIPADGTTANIYGSRVGMAAFGEFVVVGDKPEMLQVALTELGPEPKYEQKGYGEILYREAAKLAQRIGATQLYGAPTSDSAALRREKMFETELGRKTPSGFTYSSSKIDPNIRFSPEGQLEIESDGRPVPTQEELDQMKARLPKYRTAYDIQEVENEFGDLPTESTRISIVKADGTVAAIADVAYDPTDPEILRVEQSFIKDPAKNAKQGYGEALYREIAKYAQNSGATKLYGEPVSQKAATRREKLFKTELGRSDSGGYSWASSEVPASVRFAPERAEDDGVERVVKAVYRNPRTWEVSEGRTHLEANPDAPQEPTDREGPNYAFRTSTGRIVSRREAFEIAQNAGQILENLTPEQQDSFDRGVLHSGMFQPPDARGINVNSQQFPFAEKIVSGEKTIETRATPSLDPYIGQRVGIVETGKGPARVVGSAVVGEPKTYSTEEQFRADQDKHLVQPGSAFDIVPGGTKVGYPLEDVRPIEPVPAQAGGIVARKIEGVRFAPEEERATIGRAIDQIDAASSETRKAVQASADTLPYPVNPVPESVALVPRWGLINEKIVGMPKNQADVIDILDRSIMRLKRLVASNPSFARESARFYRDMGESALLLADLTDPQLDVYERFMLADLNNRFLALGSPRTGVSANASKSQSSAVARSGGFSAGWKIGFGSQQEGAKRTAEAWKRGEHFDLSMEGVQDKVRSFYLNGLSEIIEMAEEGRDAESDPVQREKYQRVVDELNLRAAKSMRIVDANATALTDEQKADIQRLLDGKATVDMWDMAAKGFAWPGWIADIIARGKVNDRGFHWTQEKFAKLMTFKSKDLQSAVEGLGVDSPSNLSYQQARLLEIDGKKDWDAETWAERKKQEFDEETKYTDLWDSLMRELGIESPSQLRYQQARSLRIDGNKDWDAESWEKRRMEPFGENTSWTNFIERTEAGLSPGGGGPLYDAQQALDGMMADRLNQLGMAELFGKRKLKARNAQEILWALEKLDNPLKGNNDLSLYGNSFKSLREELMRLKSGEPMSKKSRGVDVLAASQRVYKEMAEQVMPLEAVTKGKSKNAQVIQQQIEKLRQAGDPNPERTFTLHVANNLHNEVNAIAKKHGVDFTIDKIEPSYGGYTEGEMDISENFIITARGNIFDRERGAFPAAYAFLEGYSRGADQAAGNVIRRASLRELYTPEIEGNWTVVKGKNESVVSVHESKDKAQKEIESIVFEKRDYKQKLKALEAAKKSKDKNAIKEAKEELEKEFQKQVANLELSVTRVMPFKQATVLSFDTRHLDDAQIKAFANELGMIKDSKGGFFINGFSKTANGIVIHDGFYSGDMLAEAEKAKKSIEAVTQKYSVPEPSIEKSVVEMFFRDQDSDQITENPFTKDVQKLVEKKIRSKTITPAPARQVRDVISDWAADAKALKDRIPSMSKNSVTLAIATLNSKLDAAVLRGDITRAESLAAKAEKGFGVEKETEEEEE